MSFRTCRVVVVALAAAVVFVASGCSGSKSGSGSVPGDSGPPQVSATREATVSAVDATRSQAAEAAAENTPRPGSVTQSSNADGAGTTTDRVEVTLTAADQQINYRATQTGGRSWSIGNTGAAEVLGSVRDGDFVGIGLVSQETGGRRVLIMYTDADPEALAAGNNDWMAAGIWGFIPDSQNISDFEFGAFADGGDPFEQSNLQALTGNAIYLGEAYGVYYSSSGAGGEDSDLFNAAVRLEVDFGDAAGLGTVSGLISNVRDMDGSIAGNPEVTLGPASIGDADSGFFTGDSSMEFEDRSYAGKWGGQFLGNGAVATDSPSKVVGTFGVAAEETNAVGGLVGAFGASRTPAAPGSN